MPIKNISYKMTNLLSTGPQHDPIILAELITSQARWCSVQFVKLLNLTWQHNHSRRLKCFILFFSSPKLGPVFKHVMGNFIVLSYIPYCILYPVSYICFAFTIYSLTFNAYVTILSAILIQLFSYNILN